MQFLLFGASIVYGVGGENGGWSDKLKHKLHTRMYEPDGGGEKHEVHTFALPGATIEFIDEIHEDLIKRFSANGDVVSMVSVGLNNVKAKGSPDNFVSSKEEYTKSMTKLLTSVKKHSKKVICVGYSYVDESKAAPKHNEPPNQDSYFFNDRIVEFNSEFSRICSDLDIQFIDIIADIDAETWPAAYVYEKDGLHPNNKGYSFMFEKIWPQVEKLL